MKLYPFLPPLVLAIFSVVVIGLALQLDLSPPMIVGESMQPRAFPIFLMVLNLILVGFLVLQTWRSPPKPLPRQQYPTWGTMVLLLLFYVLTTWVDMLLAIAVVMLLMCVLWGERRISVALATAVATPLTLFLLFDMVLAIRFPRGLITNWYYG